MDEIRRVSKLLKQAFEGRAWHGPGLMEVLEGVDAPCAAAKPFPTAHSIWELVLHLIYTQERVLERLTRTGGHWDAEAAFPPVPADHNEPAWQDALTTLKANEQRIRIAVANFPEDKLDEALFKGSGRAYTNMHGYMDHNIYHAGQIAMLKRAVKGDSP